MSTAPGPGAAGTESAAAATGVKPLRSPRPSSSRCRTATNMLLALHFGPCLIMFAIYSIPFYAPDPGITWHNCTFLLSVFIGAVTVNTLYTMNLSVWNASWVFSAKPLAVASLCFGVYAVVSYACVMPFGAFPSPWTWVVAVTLASLVTQVGSYFALPARVRQVPGFKKEFLTYWNAVLLPVLAVPICFLFLLAFSRARTSLLQTVVVFAFNAVTFLHSILFRAFIATANLRFISQRIFIHEFFIQLFSSFALPRSDSSAAVAGLVAFQLFQPLRRVVMFTFAYRRCSTSLLGRVFCCRCFVKLQRDLGAGAEVSPGASQPKHAVAADGNGNGNSNVAGEVALFTRRSDLVSADSQRLPEPEPAPAHAHSHHVTVAVAADAGAVGSKSLRLPADESGASAATLDGSRAGGGGSATDRASVLKVHVLVASLLGKTVALVSYMVLAFGFRYGNNSAYWPFASLGEDKFAAGMWFTAASLVVLLLLAALVQILFRRVYRIEPFLMAFETSHNDLIHWFGLTTLAVYALFGITLSHHAVFSSFVLGSS